MPGVEPQHRPAALVLAVACRLAPLTPAADPNDELRAFLAALPAAALTAAAALAARVLPGAADRTDPAEAITTGLKVLQLVGAHTREDR
ncbi:hypothetical protein [Streptomyces sp. NPDC002851]